MLSEVRRFEHEDSVMMRHADKGKWTISKEELESQFPEDEIRLIQTVLHEELPDAETTPLTLDGLERSLRLGDQMFDHLPDRALVVLADSGRDRAVLTRALMGARIAQREAQYNRDRGEKPEKRIDMVHLTGEQMTRLMQDSHPEVLERDYESRMPEGDALLEWVRDMYAESADQTSSTHPRESTERYREAMRIAHALAPDNSRVPFVFAGIGHAAALTSLKYEKLGPAMKRDDIPQYAEMHFFTKEGAYERSEGVEI